MFPNDVAIIHGSQRIRYHEFWHHSLSLASALSKKGIGKGDTGTIMLSNTPPMLEAHFSRSEAKIVIVDREFSGVMKERWRR
ncbi:AMP-binding protein [Ensifer sp. LCM 4579]|uniref:AMP-binding protein n=1 Tax=Ensifer sp. LCM 4579 TaxID=1848292 RepID=UPI0008D95050|nr:AMP-binding protein [Ensifer sp. LCM 4579]OHV75728.1 hypothetical protein LCM4579_28070 [Ensifer sp. LCM 4579]